MKVKDLIKKLEGINPELDVFVPSESTDFEYVYAQDVSAKILCIEESGETEVERVVLIIDEQ